MLLTSEPGQTFAIGIDGKGLEPAADEPAFKLPYFVQPRDGCLPRSGRGDPTIGMTKAQAAALYAKLRDAWPAGSAWSSGESRWYTTRNISVGNSTRSSPTAKPSACSPGCWRRTSFTRTH